MTQTDYSTFAELTKDELRPVLRERRAASVTKAVSFAAQQHILRSEVWSSAHIVALYMPMSGEIDTALLQAMARLNQKHVWLPRCVTSAAEGIMEFAQSQTPQFCSGPFGILEPDPALCPTVPEAMAADLVLVPGIAFDSRGYRLGYGGGYYDRFFAARRNEPAWAASRFVGLAAEAVFIERLPRDPWDFPMHGVATEEGITWF